MSKKASVRPQSAPAWTSTTPAAVKKTKNKRLTDNQYLFKFALYQRFSLRLRRYF